MLTSTHQKQNRHNSYLRIAIYQLHPSQDQSISPNNVYYYFPKGVCDYSCCLYDSADHRQFSCLFIECKLLRNDNDHAYR